MLKLLVGPQQELSGLGGGDSEGAVLLGLGVPGEGTGLPHVLAGLSLLVTSRALHLRCGAVEPGGSWAELSALGRRMKDDSWLVCWGHVPAQNPPAVHLCPNLHLQEVRCVLA